MAVLLSIKTTAIYRAGNTGNFKLFSINKGVYKLSENASLNDEFAFAARNGNNHVIIELDANGKVKGRTTVSGRVSFLMYFNF